MTCFYFIFHIIFLQLCSILIASKLQRTCKYKTDFCVFTLKLVKLFWLKNDYCVHHCHRHIALWFSLRTYKCIEKNREAFTFHKKLTSYQQDALLLRTSRRNNIHNYFPCLFVYRTAPPPPSPPPHLMQ